MERRTLQTSVHCIWLHSAGRYRPLFTAYDNTAQDVTDLCCRQSLIPIVAPDSWVWSMVLARVKILHTKKRQVTVNITLHYTTLWIPGHTDHHWTKIFGGTTLRFMTRFKNPLSQNTDLTQMKGYRDGVTCRSLTGAYCVQFLKRRRTSLLHLTIVYLA